MTNEHNNEDYEKYCSICHRSESQAGKMLRMPGGTYTCVDCLQKMINQIENSGFDPSSLGLGPMSGMPFMGMPFGGFSEPTQDESPKAAENQETAELIETQEGEVLPAINSEEEKSDNKKENKNDGKSAPRVSIFNMSDMLGHLGMGMNKGPQVKKRKPGEKSEPVIDKDKILPPHKLKAKLDEYVVGQEKAKKVLSVAVYNHYKRVVTATEGNTIEDDVDIEKSNVLMIGPTGCGKTHIVRTLARILDVPLAITDATSLTEAGYIGDDIESVLSKLLAAADNDVDKAEVGIVFIDEIDKIAKKNSTRGRDVSGESVQQGLLKMLEGSEVEVPVGATSKNAMVPLTTINTKNILFICGGAFPDLEDIIKERLSETSSIGFMAELKDKYEADEDILSKVETEDLRKFGMIPEFLGRLPIVCTLKALTTEMLVKVFKEPKNAILKQYQKLLEMDEVQLIFEDDALEALAERAAKKQAGARGLRSIIEEIMLDIMFEIPKDDSIGTVTITRDYIENNGSPIIGLRGIDLPAEQ